MYIFGSQGFRYTKSIIPSKGSFSRASLAALSVLEFKKTAISVKWRLTEDVIINRTWFQAQDLDILILPLPITSVLPLPLLPIHIFSSTASIHICSLFSFCNSSPPYSDLLVLQSKYAKNFTISVAIFSTDRTSAEFTLLFDLYEKHRHRQTLDFECVALGFSSDHSVKSQSYTFNYKPSGNSIPKEVLFLCVDRQGL